MPTERLAMRHVRDVIRLKSAGMPSREIARRVGTAASTVRLTIRRFEASGLSWPLPDDVTDTVLEARRDPNPEISKAYPMSSAAGQHKETQDPAPNESKPRKMLTEQEVLGAIPISGTTLWRLEKAGRFPKSSYISPGRRAWFLDEVIRWQTEINGRGRGRKNHPTDSKS
jgi:predicted DNA-binding transcriptional regulator AlpA